MWTRLRAELNDAGLTPDTHPVVNFKQARQLPYLKAVVREEMQYFPGIVLGLKRATSLPVDSACRPRTVITVSEGVMLAFNLYIINRNRELWGPDSHDFRPERWLHGDRESEQALAQRLQVMNDSDLTFGAGSRVFLGKSLALMQTYKVFATLVLCYDVELVHPEREWKVINSWFPRSKGLEVRLTRRGASTV